MEESDGGQNFEKRRGIVHHFMNGGGNLADMPDHGGFADHRAVDANPLPQVQDVGRGVEADFVAVGMEHGGQHGAGGTLALGAGDVNGGDFFMGIAHQVQEAVHAFKAESVFIVP
ncbi:MAG: hypothetical protein BWY65_02352 [Firmicutes bacterium ADurb.Bin373]|nr:MAG: hypothetical protein BWY65_02352 [Firmicutes bacterium ADurb.Bin373]